MAQKKIELVFDLDANDVKIASEATLTLAQQVRVLKQELQKTQEGTKEFEILRNKLNETKDNFERVNVKSRELFGTLSLIPGPIGEIAGKLNGAISLFKTFSGFSLKDLQQQFKSFGDDIKSILVQLGSWGEKTKDIEEVQLDLKDAVNGSTAQLATAGAQVGQNIQKSSEYVNTLKQKIQTEKDYQDALKVEIQLLDEFISQNKKNSAEVQEAKKQQKAYSDELATSEQYSKRFNAELQSLTGAQNKNTIAAQQDAKAQAQVAGASEVATVATAEQTLATKGLTVAQNAASTAGRVLKGVLASLGIGLIILAVTTLISKVYEWVTSTEEADRANEKLGDTLKQLNRILEDNLSLIDEEVEIQTMRAKIAGKTEEEINNITIGGIDKRIQAVKKGRADLERELLNLPLAGLTKEQSDKRSQEIQDEYVKLGKNIIDLESQRRIQVVKGEEIVFNTQQKNREKNKDANKQAADDALQRRKAELDALIQLEINKDNTDKARLEKLLSDRLALEKKTGAELLLAQQENQDKVKNALKEDIDEQRDIRLRSIDAIIEKEQNAADVDIERLKKLLLHKRDLELTNTELLLEERQAITEKYDKIIRDIDRQQREDKLVADIAATRGNFDAQIELYRQFAQEAIDSTKYNEQEKIKIVEDANEKIRQLQEERFQAELTATQLKYGALFQYDAGYYDAVRAQYDAEEKRYKELLDQKKISQAEYDAFMKESSDARISLDKAELDSKMSNFEAVSQIFAATASLVGEQTKAGKALAIAGATIDTFVAANKVLADPTPMPTFLRFALAAATIIRGLVSVKKIVSTPIPTKGGDTGASAGPQTTGGPINVTAQRRARGGMVEGPGSEDSDSIPAYLSNGEFVVNARSTRIFQPMLKAMNDFGNAPAFAGGGLAMAANIRQNNNNPSSSLSDVISETLSNTPIRTYVSSTEISNNQQFDRVIKSRSLI